MGFDQHINFHFGSCLGEFPHLIRGKRRRDQKNRVSTPGAGFQHLVRIKHKVLPENRESHGLPHFAEHPRSAEAKLLLREHRETGRAARRIGRGDFSGPEIRTDQPL